MSPDTPDTDPQMLERLLTDLFPSEWIRQTAGTVGFVRLRRTIDPVTFLWVLVLGFGTGVSRSLASLRRAYETSSGETLVPSAFYDRFTPACVAFLRACFIRGLEEVVRHTSLMELVVQVRDLLPQCAALDYPATRVAPGRRAP